MKKILIIAAVATLAAVSSQAQGLVSISLTSAVVKTNTALNVSGVVDGSGAYNFALLVSANTALASSANQIYGNAANFALWTDVGVTGASGFGLNRGKLNGASSAVATPWTAPGVSPDNLMSVLVVGWSSAYGANWAAIANAVSAGNLAAGGFFGVTALGTSYSGGGPSSIPAVNVFGGGGTGAQGVASGMAQSLILNQVVGVPEPSTMALAALGGASLLLFRRRK